MKKLFLMTMMLLAAAACSKDETTGPAAPGGQDAIEPPHFYGMATLDNEAPHTRGVANKMKQWSQSMVGALTVKFLNGSPEYIDFVKQAAIEWEKAADVHFFFVPNTMDAMIRIGFDYVPDMKTSWSYTGTDINQLYSYQDQPTIHFAQWPRIGDAKKRSDVLRAFGQTLGLELEFRHPDAAPEWIKNADGTIIETAIKEYWEDELAGFIDWAELKKMVLDPMSVNPFFIDKTESYDENSVMNWPFFKWIDLRQEPIQFDSDFKTELSALDKKFIESLYGESHYPMPMPDLVFPLIEFDYTGAAPKLTVTTSKRLVVMWDDKACTHVEIPTGSTSPVTATVEHTYPDSIKRRIVIGEMLEYGQPQPTTSEALKAFDLHAAGTENHDIKDCNVALTNIKFRGGGFHNFKSQKLDFSGNIYLKELYLTETEESTATIKNCVNLEIFATSSYIWKPIWVNRPATFPSFNTGSPDLIVWSGELNQNVWPYAAMYEISLTDLNLELCPKLKQISLENAQLSKLDLSGHPDLEYVYLSSSPYYIVGGGATPGSYLVNALNGLPDRKGKLAGQVILRSIKLKNMPVSYDTPQPNFVYCSVPLSQAAYNTINTIAKNRNWTIRWPSGVAIE